MNYSASTIFFYESTFTVQYSARVAGLIGLADYASVLFVQADPFINNDICDAHNPAGHARGLHSRFKERRSP